MENQSVAARYSLTHLRTAHLPSVAEWYEDLVDLNLIDSRVALPPSQEMLEKLWRGTIEDTSEARRSYRFAIVEIDGDNIIGLANLAEIDYRHGTALFSIFVNRPSRRCGIGIRSLALLLDLAFGQLRLHRVWTFIRCDNLASRDMTLKCGFREEGCLRQAFFSKGKHIDINLFGVLVHEWEAARGQLNDGLHTRTNVTLGTTDNGDWSWPFPKSRPN